MSSSQGAMTPPAGIVPNFDHPKDVLNTVNLVTQILTICIVTIFICLRTLVRIRILKVFGKDDSACIIAWVLMIGYCICGIILGEHGGGHNQWEVRKSEIKPYFQTAYAATLFYAPMALAVKMALLTILIRAFAPRRKMVLCIYGVMGLLVAYYIAAFVVKVRICWPISYYWGGSKKGSCLDQGKVITSDSIMSVISDLLILILPLPLTWSLKMPLNKKLRVTGVLGAGGLATAFSIYRLAMIVQEGSSQNQTMVFTKVILSGNAEAGIGLICACLPAVTALITHRGTSTGYARHKGQMSSHELSKVKSSTLNGDRNHSHNHTTKWHGSDLELGSDEATLVSYAQGDPRIETSVHGEPGDHGESGLESEGEGIRKTVDVSTTYS